jgi:hypothetical protein
MQSMKTTGKPKYFLNLTPDLSYIGIVMSITRLRRLLSICLCLPIVALAQSNSSVSQRLTVEVRPITQIAVSGNPGPMFITDLGSGSGVLSASDNSTKYSMLTNLENMKIVASINGPMPQGTKLMVKMETSAGQSNGFVDVSNASLPVDVVTGISKGSDRNQSITYAFAADPSVTQVNTDSRVVTLTLTN